MLKIPFCPSFGREPGPFVLPSMYKVLTLSVNMKPVSNAAKTKLVARMKFIWLLLLEQSWQKFRLSYYPSGTRYELELKT